jgi:hypothetical protein
LPNKQVFLILFKYISLIIYVGCLRATTEGLPKVKDPANPVGDEEKYDRWNAKEKIHSTRAFTRISSIMYVM